MAQLQNPTMSAALRDDINRAIKGQPITTEEAVFLASRMGVQPNTVKGWFSPNSQSVMIPAAMIGKPCIGGAISTDWRARAVLGLALLGEIESTSTLSGVVDNYKDEVRGTLIDVFKRLTSYLQYGISWWRNESWRIIRVNRNNRGQWTINVTYERIPSEDEEEQSPQEELDFPDEDRDETLDEDWSIQE